MCYSIEVVSNWFSVLFLKMLRLGELRVCSGSSFESRTAEGKKIYSKDENSYVMFVGVKGYLKGMLTHC